MKRLFAGECSKDNVYSLVDPSEFCESAFEAEVIRALSCLQPDYICGVFSGAFVLEGLRRVSDLALIHRSFSHWFVVEVELAGHSLEHHVLPQVRCFRYGMPEATCVTSLLRAFDFLSPEQASGLLEVVPRFVAVIANRADPMWLTQLSALDVQLLTVSIYRNEKGVTAREVEGTLTATEESLGFGRYSEIDRCLSIASSCGLKPGQIQVIDQFGVPSSWTVREDLGKLWISRDCGPALLTHNSYVQVIRAFDGRVYLRPSTTTRS